MFGHGHAAGADIAVDINFALGHRVGDPIGRVAVYDNLSAGVEPPDIVGSRTENFNDRIGNAHGSQTLTGRAGNIDFNLFFSGPPKTSTQTVLSVSGYFNMMIILRNGSLNAFFQNARFNSDSVFLSGDFYRFFPGHIFYESCVL